MARLAGGKLCLMPVLGATAHANVFEPATVCCSDVLARMKVGGARVLGDRKSRARGEVTPPVVARS